MPESLQLSQENLNFTLKSLTRSRRKTRTGIFTSQVCDHLRTAISDLLLIDLSFLYEAYQMATNWTCPSLTATGRDWLSLAASKSDLTGAATS